MQVLGWSLTVAGVLMWLTGGIFFGRDRGLHWFPALCLHLLPVLGLILILRIGKSPSRHAASVRKNRRLDDKTARRTYRPLKPLY